MTDELDGANFTSSGADGPWPTISVPFEWVVADETGVSSGPIRRGQIIGGKFDGGHVQTDSDGGSGA